MISEQADSDPLAHFKALRQQLGRLPDNAETCRRIYCNV